MNQNDAGDPGDTLRRDADAIPDPAPEGDARAKAGELLAHGLLGYLQHDRPDAQEQRISRVLDLIEREGATAVAAPRSRSVLRALRPWAAVAAAIGILTAAAMFGLPGETSAQATIRESITAMRAGGDRRYEMRTQRQGEDAVSEQARGIVDTRSPDLLLMQLEGHDGRRVVVGRDEQGTWVIRRDGAIERDPPRAVWPKFATVGDESLFADSIDQVLEQMARSHEMTRQPDEVLDGHGAEPLEHIRGIKKVRQPGPAQIDVWISRGDRVVERVEMRFDDPPRPGERPPRPGPGRRPVEGQRGEPDEANSEREPGLDGRPPRVPPAMHGGMRGLHPDDRPPRPDRRDDALRGEPPHRGGPGGGPNGPMRPRGPGGEGGRGPGGQPMPPRVLVLERVPAPLFEAGWFSPEAHKPQ